MALLNSLRSSKAQTKEIINKAKKTTKPPAQMRVAGGVTGQITQMIDLVERKLGKYKDKYILIRSQEDLSNYMQAIETVGYGAIDTETTGLDFYSDKVVGVCLYTKGQKAAYIPMEHESYVTGIKSSNQLPRDAVAKALENCKTKWIMHNAKFDIKMMKHSMGIDIPCYWDTQVASFMLDENEPHRLKYQHLKYCKSEDTEALDFDKLFNGITFSKVPINTAYLYAAGDAIKTYELWEYQKSVFEQPGFEEVYKVFKNIEMPTLPVVIAMEDRGVAIDFTIANGLIEKYQGLKAEAEKQADQVQAMYVEDIENYKMKNPKAKIDIPIKLSSPTQLAILFYDILKLESPDKKSPRGTGEEILEHFAKGKHKDLCEIILKMRGLDKLLSTYIEKMPELAKRDGRIHCQFNQNGAKTGRFSSDSPNLQNIPSHNKEIRTMFKATDGYVLVGGDYSKQEIMIAASISKDEKMIESCKRNTDIYSEIAAIAFSMPYEECVEFRPDHTVNPAGKERRGQAKAIVLGILYGKGVPAIATDLNITKQKAQNVYDSVLKAFPQLSAFMDSSQEGARINGYVETLWGRRRHLPDMQLKPYEFKLADGTPMGFDPLDFDNDELSFEVPEDVKKELTKQLNKAYGFKAKNAVKMTAKAKGILITDNGGYIAQAERQCVNSRVQGSAGDLTKMAMINIHNDKIMQDLGFHLLITIHDEVIGECPKENARAAEKRLVELMSTAGNPRVLVPLKVDTEITYNWYGETADV